MAAALPLSGGVILDVEPVHEMEKVLFAADEADGTDLGSCADAAFEEHKRHGTEILKEKRYKKQRIRCRMLQRSHPAAEPISSAGNWKKLLR